LGTHERRLGGASHRFAGEGRISAKRLLFPGTYGRCRELARGLIRPHALPGDAMFSHAHA